MGLRKDAVFTTKSGIVWLLMLCLAVSTEVQARSVPNIKPLVDTSNSTISPNALNESVEPAPLFELDQSFLTNVSSIDKLASNENDFALHDQINSFKSPEEEEQKEETACCISELTGKMATLFKETSNNRKMQGSAQSENEIKNLSLSAYNGSLESETDFLYPVNLRAQVFNSSINYFDIALNETDEIAENVTFEQSQTINLDSNTTSSQSKKVRVWEKGLLKRKLLNKILTYFRACMIVPVFISVLSVILTVVVFKNKSFVYYGKPLVISFNIFEGLKSIAYLVFRIVKLYIGDEQITWSSWYAQFFMYYITWLPISLGRIGFLHNGLITLDRFFTVAFPLRRFNKRLVTCPKICIAIIVISMVAYQSAPMILFFMEVKPRLNYQRTFRSDEIISEVYVANPVAFGTYWRVLLIGDALFAYVPIILALVFNILTLIALWRHKQMVQATLKNNFPSTSSGPLSKAQAVKRQTNYMIVVSSFIFAVLVLFRRLLPLVALFVKDFGEGRREMHLYILLNDIFTVFDCLSPLANFISYTSLSSQFRGRLKKILFPKFNKSASSTTSKDSGGNESI